MVSNWTLAAPYSLGLDSNEPWNIALEAYQALAIQRNTGILKACEVLHGKQSFQTVLNSWQSDAFKGKFDYSNVRQKMCAPILKHYWDWVISMR